MNNYDVYGLGNALMDIEYEIREDFLDLVSVDKGVMTLADASVQAELALRLNEHFVPKKSTGGGSAANTMVAVTQLGGSAFYSCKVANDDTGQLYLQDLKNCGVETTPPTRNDPGNTGQCLIMITPDAERTMSTHLGISQDLSVAELSEDALRRSSHLYIEGYLVTSPSALAAALQARDSARQASVPVAVTLSDPSIVMNFRSEFNLLLEGGVDLMFCNRDEALIFTERERVEDAASELMKSCGQFAITLGDQGALLFDGTTLFTVAAVPTEAIDTNGAGDLFAGVFLYGLTHGLGFEKAAKLANQSAAALIARFGARLSKDEQQQILKDFEST